MHKECLNTCLKVCFTAIIFLVAHINATAITNAPLAPGNDQVASAITVSGSDPCLTSTNVGATPDGALTFCSDPKRNVWFKFQALTSYIKIDVKTGEADGTITSPEFSLWKSTDVNGSSLTGFGCVDGQPSSLIVTLEKSNLEVGSWYFISIYADGTQLSVDGTFTLCLADRPSSNDYLLGATSIVAADGCVPGSNAGATMDGTQSACGMPHRNVWYRFQALTPYIKIDVKTGTDEGTIWNPEFSLWKSSDIYGTTLTETGCANSGSGLVDVSLEKTDLSIGAWYYISIYADASLSSYDGTFTLCLTDQPSSNNLQVGATTVTPSGACVSGSNIGATQDGTTASCGQSGRNVWFKFKALTPYIKIDVKTGTGEGTISNPGFSLWKSTDIYPANMTEAGCVNSGTGLVDVSLEKIDLTVGSWYYVSVYANSPTASNDGTFLLCLNSQPSSNDLQVGAFTVVPNAPCSTGSNVAATADGATATCGAPKRNVWYRFQASTPYIKIDVKTGTGEGTIQNAQFSLWKSNAQYPTGMVEVGCVNSGSGLADVSLEKVNLIIGAWYYISIYANSSLTSNDGTFTLCLNDQSPIDHQVGALTLAPNSACLNTKTTVGATPDGATGACGAPTRNIWFKFQAATPYIKIDVKTGTGEGTISSPEFALWKSSDIYPANMTEVGCVNSGSGLVDVSLEQVSLSIGSWYYISVYSSSSLTSNDGTFTICLNDQSPIDHQVGALTLVPNSACLNTKTTAGATSDGAAGACGTPTRNVWFKFQAATPYIKIDVKTGTGEGTISSPEFSLWKSTDIYPANMTEVGCVNSGTGLVDVSLEQVSLSIGSWYYVSVYSSSSASSDGTFTICLNDQPPFDHQVGAIIVTGSDVCSSRSNIGATPDGANSTCGAPDRNVWFKFKALTPYIKIDVKTGSTYGTIKNPEISLWKSTDIYPANMTEAGCAPSGSGLVNVSLEKVDLSVNSWYYISVYANSSVSSNDGTFTLCLTDQAPFDYQVGALTLVPNSACLNTKTTVGATSDGAAGACGTPTRNVWFKFQAATPYIKIDVKTGAGEGTISSPEFSLWKSNGVYPTNMNEAGCVDSGSGLVDVSLEKLSLSVGSWYYISVYSSSSSASNDGTFTICLNDQAPFDYQIGALTLVPNSACLNTKTTVGATTDGPTSACGTPTRNVWFKFQAATSYIKVDVKTGPGEGTISSPEFSLWKSTGTNPMFFTEAGCVNSGNGLIDVSLEALSLTAGSWYYISVYSSSSLASNDGTFTICLNDQAPPDHKLGAVLLSSTDNFFDGPYTNVAATADGNPSDCSSAINNVWFKFYAATNFIKVDVKTGPGEGTIENPVVALWSEYGAKITCASSTTTLGDVSLQASSLSKNQVYFISVDNKNSSSAEGTFKLAVNKFDCQAPLNVYALDNSGPACLGTTASSITMQSSQPDVIYTLGATEKSNNLQQPITWTNLSPGTYNLKGRKGSCPDQTISSETIVLVPVPAPITSVRGLKTNFTEEQSKLTVDGASDAVSLVWASVAGTTISPTGGTAPGRDVVISSTEPGQKTLKVKAFKGGCYGPDFDVPITILPSVAKSKTMLMQAADIQANASGFMFLEKNSHLYSGCITEYGPVTIKVKANFGDVYNLYGNEGNTFTVTINATVTAYSDLPGVEQSWPVTFTLTQTSPEALFVKTITPGAKQLKFIGVKVNSFTSTNADIGNAVKLFGEYEEANKTQANSATVSLIAPQVTDPVTGNPKWEVKFDWTSACPDVPNYEFQLLRLYGSEAINWNNALKLYTESPATEITVSMAEGGENSTYHWRVRAIGNLTGGITNAQNFLAPWSTSSFQYTHPEAQKNWIYNRAFTEGNRVTENVTYANGLQQIGQQQTRIQDINEIVAVQTLQDYAGRNAVSSLPVPVSGAKKLGYISGLLKNTADNSNYTAKQFDVDPKTPTPASDISGYYSGNDNGMNAGVASAEGFPYTRTFTDAEGNIEQAGVGVVHSMAGNRTIRTRSRPASEAELVMLFGREAPAASSVQKIETYDANGKGSVAYKTKTGKTIATALIISDIAALTPISTQSTPVFEEVIGREKESEFSVISRKEFTVNSSTEQFKFTYELTPTELNDLCSNAADANGLIRYFKFNGNGNDATGIGTSAFPASGNFVYSAAGHQAYDLNGSTAYVSIGDASDLNFSKTDFTISFWVRKDANTTSSLDNAAGINKWSGITGTMNNMWKITLGNSGSDNVPGFVVQSGNTEYQVLASTNLATGIWNHVTAVRKGAKISIYVNGNLEGEQPLPQSAVLDLSTQTILVGKNTNGLNTDAAFDDLMIYNRGVSAQEVRALYYRTGILSTTCDYKIELRITKADDPSYSHPGLPQPLMAFPGDPAGKNGTVTGLTPGVTYILEKRVYINELINSATGHKYLVDHQAVIENHYRAQASAALSAINGYINSADATGLLAYLNTTYQLDETGKYYVVPVGAAAGGCPQFIYIPKLDPCPPADTYTSDCKLDDVTSTNKTFEQYFNAYYGITATSGQMSHLFFKHPETGVKKYFNVGQFDVMMTNLLNENPHIPCSLAWEVWKGEVASYESQSQMQADAAQLEGQDKVDYDNATGSIPDAAMEYSLLQSFLTAIDRELQRTIGSADLCTPWESNNSKPKYFIERNTLFGRVGASGTLTTLSATNGTDDGANPDILHAYHLVYYNSLVPEMRNALVFYKNIPTTSSGPTREPDALDFKSLSLCDKYKFHLSSKFGNLGYNDDTNAESEETIQAHISALRYNCYIECESRREEFKQALINKLYTANPSIKIEHYNVFKDVTYLVASMQVWKGMYDLLANTSGYTMTECALESMVDGLVANCKNYCNTPLTVTDVQIPDRPAGQKVRVYGTTDQQLQLRKPFEYNFEVEINSSCASGWNLIDEAHKETKGLAWAKTAQQGGAYYNACFDVDSKGNTVYANTLSNGYLSIDKVSKLGAVLWSRNLPLITQLRIYDIQIDHADNVLVMFQQYSTTTTLYVRKLNASGVMLWEKSTSYNNGISDYDPKLRVDSDNEIFISGNYASIDVDFNSSNGTGLLSVTSDRQFFLAKYNQDLNYIWHVSSNLITDDEIRGTKAMEIDGSDNVIISASVMMGSGEQNFIGKYSGYNGDLFWYGSFTGVAQDDISGGPQSVTIGESNTIYLTGSFKGQMDVDPSIENATILSASGTTNRDIYIIKLYSSGGLIWAKQIGSTGDDIGMGISFEKSTNLFSLTGTYDGTVDFDFTNGTYSMSGSQAMFLVKYHNDGSVVSGFSFDAIPSELGFFTQLTGNDLYLSGGVHGTLDIDPSAQVYNIYGAAEANTAFFSQLRLVPDNCIGQSMCFRFTTPFTIGPVSIPGEMQDHVYQPDVVPACGIENLDLIKATIALQTEQIADERLENFRKQYMACGDPANINDKLTVSYASGLHHFTLYYYDLAGNLIKTIPPKGVVKLDVSTETALAVARNATTQHTMATEYHYNSLGQLVREHAPDSNPLTGKPAVNASESVMNGAGYYASHIYNDNALLRFTQNAKQKSNGTYAYSKYDVLGRVIEVGEATGYNETTLYANRNNDGTFPASGTQVTKTVYTTSITPSTLPAGYTQRYLQNRVSYAVNDEDGNLSTTTDQTTTVYSYDIHGNVEWLVQLIPGLSAVGIKYQYDLLSGKVTGVSYNPGQPDEFYHRYEYDASNRITSVSTSKNGYQWEREATYDYYLHGPLKRTLIGQDNLQGIDYTYTIQGWMKGINHHLLDIVNDPKHDGESGSVTGRDAFGMALTYYTGDYKRTGSPLDAETASVLKPTTGRDLYNGNISAWAVRNYYSGSINTAYASAAINLKSNVTGYVFEYDELNRLLKSDMKSFNGTNDYTSLTDYQTRQTYDANGNILTKINTGSSATVLDDFTYAYSTNTNLLTRVSDAASASPGFGQDVEPGQAANNYVYDAIGNLTSDIQQGTTITWSPYGKVLQVSKGANTFTKFRYDAAGNRVSKRRQISANVAITSYYVRDASGNIMGVYDKTEDATTSTTNLIELPIYGNDRLGIYNKAVAMGTTPPASNGLFSRNLKSRQYDLKDHLGNVRVVITDQKLSLMNAAVAGSYEPNVINVQNYYDFGMDQPGRSWSAADKYRYGFNGKEKDDNGEWGSANYDYGFRIFNPSIGRFLSVDPLTKSYSMLTPYQFASNTPIMAVDLDGLEKKTSIQGQCIDGKCTMGSDNYISLKDEAELKLQAQQAMRKQSNVPDPTPGNLDIQTVNLLLGVVDANFTVYESNYNYSKYPTTQGKMKPFTTPDGNFRSARAKQYWSYSRYAKGSDMGLAWATTTLGAAQVYDQYKEGGAENIDKMDLVQLSFGTVEVTATTLSWFGYGGEALVTVGSYAGISGAVLSIPGNWWNIYKGPYELQYYVPTTGDTQADTQLQLDYNKGLESDSDYFCFE
jgi:RHS repeat-associated protein